jgi:hypothetical protein
LKEIAIALPPNLLTFAPATLRELDFERPFLLPDNLLAKVISQASQAFG